METWIELRARGGYVVRRTKVKKTILARSVPFFFFLDAAHTRSQRRHTHTCKKKKKDGRVEREKASSGCNEG